MQPFKLIDMTDSNLLNSASSPISLYFHIPFCTKKCAYCHFFVLPDKDPFKQQLMQGLYLEWQRWLPALLGKKIVSIYFGGGTPALIGAEAIEKILGWVKTSFDCTNAEITLEANPENINPALMKAYANAGINRVSIGVQTLDTQLLEVLQRIHDPKKALDAIQLTYDAGISNISIDLMYDLPGQTIASWQRTLEEARKQPITHLSLYNLTIEPHTVFFKYRETLQRQLPDAEASLHMYEMAIDMLNEFELKQYEISAFAKNDFFSRHNVGYWTGRPFIGFGPSAFSYWEGRRFRNVANLNRYCKNLESGTSPIDFDELLDLEARKRELLVVQLRLIAGVNLDSFQKIHGQLDLQTQGAIQQLQADGLLKFEDGYLKMTRKGVLFYDTVAAELV
jgi:oxygen-independent coproporphyrinogen III oxidase